MLKTFINYDDGLQNAVRVNGVAETSRSGEERRVGMVNSNQQVPVEMRMRSVGGVEENALRDVIYRSSRCGWTNAIDRSRQQPQQPTINTVGDVSLNHFNTQLEDHTSAQRRHRPTTRGLQPKAAQHKS